MCLKTSSLALREAYRFKMFDNRVTRVLLVPSSRKWQEGGKLRYKELHDFYFFPDVIMVINKGGWKGQGMWHAGEKKNKLKAVGLKHLK